METVVANNDHDDRERIRDGQTEMDAECKTKYHIKGIKRESNIRVARRGWNPEYSPPNARRKSIISICQGTHSLCGLENLIGIRQKGSQCAKEIHRERETKRVPISDQERHLEESLDSIA